MIFAFMVIRRALHRVKVNGKNTLIPAQILAGLHSGFYRRVGVCMVLGVQFSAPAMTDYPVSRALGQLLNQGE